MASFQPYRFSCSCGRNITMPGCAKSGSSTAYPRADSTIDAPFTLTSRVAGQIDTPLCLYTGSARPAARRSSARMGASSSSRSWGIRMRSSAPAFNPCARCCTESRAVAISPVPAVCERAASAAPLTRHPRQAKIEQHQVVGWRLQRCERYLAVAHPVHCVAHSSKLVKHRLADRGVVFNQQRSHGVACWVWGVNQAWPPQNTPLRLAPA